MATALSLCAADKRPLRTSRLRDYRGDIKKLDLETARFIREEIMPRQIESHQEMSALKQAMTGGAWEALYNPNYGYPFGRETFAVKKFVGKGYAARRSELRPEAQRSAARRR